MYTWIPNVFTDENLLFHITNCWRFLVLVFFFTCIGHNITLVIYMCTHKLFNCSLIFQWFVVPTALILSGGWPSKKKYGGAKYPTSVLVVYIDKINHTRRAGKEAYSSEVVGPINLFYNCNQHSLFFFLFFLWTTVWFGIPNETLMVLYNEIIYLFWNFCE